MLLFERWFNWFTSKHRHYVARGGEAREISHSIQTYHGVLTYVFSNVSNDQQSFVNNASQYKNLLSKQSKHTR